MAKNLIFNSVLDKTQLESLSKKASHWTKLREENPEEYEKCCAELSLRLKGIKKPEYFGLLVSAWWKKMKEKTPEVYEAHCQKLSLTQKGIKKPSTGTAKSLYWKNLKENNPEEYKLVCQKITKSKTGKKILKAKNLEGENL